jgi:hypothetical protein
MTSVRTSGGVTNVSVGVTNVGWKGELSGCNIILEAAAKKGSIGVKNEGSSDVEVVRPGELSVGLKAGIGKNLTLGAGFTHKEDVDANKLQPGDNPFRNSVTMGLGFSF